MSILKRYTTRGLMTALSAGAAMGVLGSNAVAQNISAEPPLTLQTDYFGWAASVAGRFEYSDNIGLNNDGAERDEFIFATQFSGGAVTSTNRFTGIVLADLDFSYLLEEEDFNVSQNVGATGTATVADNWLYVDVSGASTRQLIGDNARFSRSFNSGRGQQASVHSFSASPYLYHRMPDQSSVSLRYRYSQVLIDDSESDFTPFFRNFLNDSRSQEAIAQYNSGNLLDRVRFTATAYGNDTQEDGSDALPDFGYRQGVVEGGAQIALSDQFSLSGAAGYEEIDTQDAAALFFNDDELSGVFWRAGFTARPNRRASARIEYGQRYGDDFVDASISYQLTNRINFRAGANRAFRTRAQTNTTRFQEVQTQTLRYVDQLREGGELSPRGVISGATQFAAFNRNTNSQVLGVGVIDSAFAALNLNYGRTRFSLNGRYADSDFGFRQIESLDINANMSREISRKASGYARLGFRNADTMIDADLCQANPLVFGFDITDPLFNAVTACDDLIARNGETNTVIGTLGLQYQLYENVTAFGEYSHTKRFSPVSLLEYSENSVFMGISFGF